MNINEALFNEVKNKLLDLPTDPLFKKVSENFQNENLQYFGICFCQKRLLDAYNCTFKEYKTPNSIISDCFIAGVLARKLYNINDTDDAIIEIRNILHGMKLLYGTRVLLRDGNDNRYEIPNLLQLDKRSRQLIDSYL